MFYKSFLVVFTLLLLLSFSFLPVSAEGIKDGSIIIEAEDEAAFFDLSEITFLEAMESAIGEVPGKVLEVELQEESGFLVYEVEIVNDSYEVTEVYVDAGNGDILGLEVEDEAEVCEKFKPGSINLHYHYPEIAAITFEEAINAASMAVSKNVLEIELDQKKDFLVYEVKVVNEDNEIVKVCVDAGNGEILATKIKKEDSHGWKDKDKAFCKAFCSDCGISVFCVCCKAENEATCDTQCDTRSDTQPTQCDTQCDTECDVKCDTQSDTQPSQCDTQCPTGCDGKCDTQSDTQPSQCDTQCPTGCDGKCDIQKDSICPECGIQNQYCYKIVCPKCGKDLLYICAKVKCSECIDKPCSGAECDEKTNPEIQCQGGEVTE